MIMPQGLTYINYINLYGVDVERVSLINVSLGTIRNEFNSRLQNR